ncbi:MAG: hypothetical protein WHT08_18085 [Bryobacteraceae bacterium]
MANLSIEAVAHAGGIPAATLRSWLHRGYLPRPAAWQPEDGVLVRTMAHLIALGYQPDVAGRIVDTYRREIARGEGWLILTRGHAFALGADGSITRGGALALTRKEDVQTVLGRLIDSGLDVAEAVLVDLRRLREKSELALAHFNATRRRRGRPRKNKEAES